MLHMLIFFSFCLLGPNKSCPISAVRSGPAPVFNQPPCSSMQERLAKTLPAGLTVFSNLLSFVPPFQKKINIVRVCVITVTSCPSDYDTHLPFSLFFPLQIDFCEAVISRLCCITPCRPSEGQANCGPFPDHFILRPFDFHNRRKQRSKKTIMHEKAKAWNCQRERKCFDRILIE